MNISYYSQIIKKRRYMIISCLLSGIIIAFIVNVAKKPVYKSRSTIEIKIRSLEQEQSEGQYNVTINEIISTECRKIVTYPIIRKTAESLNIISENFSAEENNGILEYIQENTFAERIKGTNIIQVTSVYNNPKKVASIVNKIIQIYIDKRMEERDSHFYKIIDPVERQLNEVRKTLDEDKEMLRIFSEKYGYAEDSEVLKAKLVDLELELTKLLRKYNYQHPDVIDLKSQIKETKKKLDLSSRRIQLIAKVKSNEELYDSLDRKFKKYLSMGADRIERLSIISPASVPIRPVKQGKGLNLLIGVGAGILFGLFLVLIKESREFSVKDIEKIETALKIPIIGVIPYIERMDKIAELQNRLLLYQSAKSPITESYYNFWTNIRLALSEKKGKVLLFTSADSKEGKTLTVINCAIASAMAGIKTLLIETDSKALSVQRVFNLSQRPGLNEIISKGLNWREVLQGTTDFFKTKYLKSHDVDNLKVITYGEEPSDPMGVLDSGEMDLFIGEAKREFELVLFDSSPLLLSAEPVILSTKTDNVVLVHQIGKVPLELLRRAKMQLEDANVSILGIVINNVRALEKYPHYAYYPGKYFKQKRIKHEREIVKLPGSGEIKKVLVVDDEYTVANVITKMLLKKSKYEYKTSMSSNGVDALNKIDTFKPDLIILDLNLPGIDGFEICKKIRSDPQKKNIKILAISGYDEPGKRERILSCGANEYLTKPFDFAKFVDYIDKLPQ